MEKFNAAVIGAGGMGKVHVDAALASEHIDHLFVVDPDPERLKLWKGDPRLSGATFEEILADESVKFVTVSSPNHLHLEQTERAMRAGKAVLCEKPMGNTLDEAKKIIALEKETGNFLQIGFELHYSKLYQIAKEWIDAGLIGDVVNIQTRYFCSESHGKNTWRSNSPEPGFLIGEKLSHYLDLQRFFFDADFESVYAVAAPKIVPFCNHEDNHQIMTKFPGGKVGVLNFVMCIGETWHDTETREMLEKQSDDGHALEYHICGTKGAIETDVFRRRIRRWEFTDSPSTLESRIVETRTFSKEEDQTYFHNVYGQDLAVIDLFAKGKKSEMNSADAYGTMKLCFAAELSELDGKVIESSDPRL
ncbi:MAG: Gfo/Idh/MocA family oxidoreductase [Lentisphaeria bacterium]|nr:Gfo/Idh/MocA family oxidoreductase [Lentisphaeria bacterium]